MSEEPEEAAAPERPEMIETTVRVPARVLPGYDEDEGISFASFLRLWAVAARWNSSP